MNPEDEISLIGRIAQGNEVAFAEIYNRYRNRIYGFACRMTFNQATAEDITHETFLILIERPERFDVRRGSLLTFLCGIARNLVMNHLRRKHNADVGFEDFENFDAAEDVVKNNPLKDLLNRELAAHVNDCIAALPPLQREAIILREFGELSYEEIASVTETEIGAVKARLHRARQTLAGELAAYVATAPPNKNKCYELH